MWRSILENGRGRSHTHNSLNLPIDAKLILPPVRHLIGLQWYAWLSVSDSIHFEIAVGYCPSNWKAHVFTCTPPTHPFNRTISFITKHRMSYLSTLHSVLLLVSSFQILINSSIELSELRSPWRFLSLVVFLSMFHFTQITQTSSV